LRIYSPADSADHAEERSKAALYRREKTGVGLGSSFVSRREKHTRNNLGITFISNQYHVLFFFVYLPEKFK